MQPTEPSSVDIQPVPAPPSLVPIPQTNGVNGHADEVQLAALLESLQAVAAGDFSVRMPGSATGLIGKVADTFNVIVAANQRMAQQLDRVGELVGREGSTRRRVRLSLSDGAWGEMESSINTLIDDLLWP